jgi:hypothetical protein
MSALFLSSPGLDGFDGACCQTPRESAFVRIGRGVHEEAALPVTISPRKAE